MFCNSVSNAQLCLKCGLSSSPLRLPLALQADGSVVVPEVLRPYLGGMALIQPKRPLTYL